MEIKIWPHPCYADKRIIEYIDPASSRIRKEVAEQTLPPSGEQPPAGKRKYFKTERGITFWL
jgi:hypothetical protein